ncbi:hypothetical protein VCM39_12525 [Bacteroides sp. CG01]|uniref:hypothetical protein n=1 Tax=Bacteroides sp. CG01 TaxID=3096000 RepID=UPI002AFFB921|nr:hypothetical protein [Bacteroides sp. CG01]
METLLLNSIEITISGEVEANSDSSSYHILSSVSRTVTVNGKEIYRDKMSPETYMASEDPIRNLENYLLGLEKKQNHVLWLLFEELKYI